MSNGTDWARWREHAMLIRRSFPERSFSPRFFMFRDVFSRCSSRRIWSNLLADVVNILKGQLTDPMWVETRQWWFTVDQKWNNVLLFFFIPPLTIIWNGERGRKTGPSKEKKYSLRVEQTNCHLSSSGVYLPIRNSSVISSILSVDVDGDGEQVDWVRRQKKLDEEEEQSHFEMETECFFFFFSSVFFIVCLAIADGFFCSFCSYSPTSQHDDIISNDHRCRRRRRRRRPSSSSSSFFFLRRRRDGLARCLFPWWKELGQTKVIIDQDEITRSCCRKRRRRRRSINVIGAADVLLLLFFDARSVSDGD